MKRTLAVFLLILLCGLFPSRGEEAVSSSASLSAVEPVYPKVVDRITTPGAYPDFTFSGEDDLLDIWFPIIRDQDAAILRYQDQIWMIDCGDERAETEIVPLLESLGISQVDRLINTHPHHDHLNGLYAIDAEIPVKELLICFPEDATRHMTAAMEYCRGNGIPVTSFADESVLGLGDGAVSLLCWQKSAEEDSVNDRSAQIMLGYGDCNMLFMADMEVHGQRQLYAALAGDPDQPAVHQALAETAALLKADILRYPHHGKQYMFDPLWQLIAPELTIITNTMRIAEIKAAVTFLENKHAAVAYTHQPPWVLHLQTDGNHWLCEQLAFDPAPWLTQEEGSD